MRSRTRPRSRGTVRDQAGKAAAAAATARSTSAARARGTVPIGSRRPGFSTTKVSPANASHHWPPISICFDRPGSAATSGRVSSSAGVAIEASSAYSPSIIRMIAE